MKKVIISMMAIGALSLAVTFGVKAFSGKGQVNLLNANIEALTDGEELDKGTLMSNISHTVFCCIANSDRDCAAAEC